MNKHLQITTALITLACSEAIHAQEDSTNAAAAPATNASPATNTAVAPVTNAPQNQATNSIQSPSTNVTVSPSTNTATVPSTPVVQNLLTNGNFAQDLTGWIVGQPGGTPVEGKIIKAEVVADSTQKSGKVLRLTDENPGGGIAVWQDAPCTAGVTYVVTVNSQSTASEKKGVGYLMLTFIGQDNKEMICKTPEEKLANSKAVNFTLPGEGFKENSGEIIAPAGATKARIRCAAGSGSVGVVDVAEVKLVPKAP